MHGARKLSQLLLQKNLLKIELIEEEFVVDAIRSLYFHTTPTWPFRFSSGKFELVENLGTEDITPKALKQLTTFLLELADDLLQINMMITKQTTDAVTLVLQDAIHKYICTPFYNSVETAESRSIVDLSYHLRSYAKLFKKTILILKSESIVDKLFHMANNGVDEFYPIAVSCLKLFKRQCEMALSPENHLILRSSLTFLKLDDGKVVVDGAPRIFPTSFLKNLSDAAYSQILRHKSYSMAPDSTKHLEVDIYQPRLQTFDVSLPDSVPTTGIPMEDVMLFRSAAWGYGKNAEYTEKEEVIPRYANIEDAVQNILVLPVKTLIQQVQANFIGYLVNEIKLLALFDQLCDLFLMRRADLHQEYLRGAISKENARVLFLNNYQIPHFDFRFVEPDSIAVSLPPELKSIIRPAQIQVYRKFYGSMYKIRLLHIRLAQLPKLRSTASLRMNLLQIVVGFIQDVSFKIGSGHHKLFNRVLSSKSLDDIASAHEDFCQDLTKLIFKDADRATELAAKLFP